MAVKNLKVERWTEENMKIINTLSGDHAHTVPSARRERWTWEYAGRSYRTDNSGSGVWCDGRQVTGTCDFSLFGYTVSGARKKLNREFSF